MFLKIRILTGTKGQRGDTQYEEVTALLFSCNMGKARFKPLLCQLQGHKQHPNRVLYL